MKYLVFLALGLLLVIGCGPGSDSGFTSSVQTQSPSFSARFASALEPVATNAKLVIEFSAALDESTVTSDSVYIHDAVGSPYPATLSISSQSVTLTPDYHFEPLSSYTLYVTTAVTDFNGSALSTDYTWDFNTTASADTTPPTVATTLPFDDLGSMDWPVEADTDIAIQFSEIIQPQLVTGTTLTVIDLDDGNATASGTISVSGSHLYFRPDANLTLSHRYRMDLDTSKIVDLAGNPMGGSFSSQFTVVSGSSISTEYFKQATLNLAVANAYTINQDGSQGLLFVGTSEGLELVEFNASTPAFSSVSSLSLPAVYGIDVDGSRSLVYLATESGFVAVDYSTPASPQVTSEYNLTYPAYGVTYEGNNAYVAASLLGVVGLNMSDAANPVKLFETDTNGVAFDVMSTGTELIVADYDQGVKRMGFDGSNAGTLLDRDSGIVKGESRALFKFYRSDDIRASFYVATGIGEFINYRDGTSGYELWYQEQPRSYAMHVSHNNGVGAFVSNYSKGVSVYYDGDGIQLRAVIDTAYDAIATLPVGSYLIVLGSGGELEAYIEPQ